MSQYYCITEFCSNKCSLCQHKRLNDPKLLKGREKESACVCVFWHALCSCQLQKLHGEIFLQKLPVSEKWETEMMMIS